MPPLSPSICSLLRAAARDGGGLLAHGHHPEFRQKKTKTPKVPAQAAEAHTKRRASRERHRARAPRPSPPASASPPWSNPSGLLPCPWPPAPSPRRPRRCRRPPCAAPPLVLRDWLVASCIRYGMEPDQPLPFVSEGLGEFMSAMGWNTFEGQPSSVVPLESPKPVQLDDTIGALRKKARKKVCALRKNPNFSPNEDKMLVMSYLEVSCDAVVNTAQKKERLWSRILNQYNQKRGNYPERTMRSAQSRWDVIKLEVGKFCGYYSEVLRGNHSGMTDADKTSHAASQFAQAEGYPFAYMHCWDIMKDEPKWMDTKHNKGQRVPPSEEGVDPFVGASNSMAEEGVDASDSPSAATSSGKRPLGRDATKAARKKSSSASSSSVAMDFAANLQELTITKSTQWQEEFNRRTTRDQELIVIEKKKHEDMLQLHRDKLELERVKIQLQRISEEERILSIDLDSVPNERLRAYYKKMQDVIMKRV